MVAWAEKPDGSWTRTLVHDFGAPVWRVSWSVTGEESTVKAPPTFISQWLQAANIVGHVCDPLPD